MADGKRKRTPKQSRGINGGGGKVHNLSRLDLYLLGKGPTLSAQ